jgi:hypothetical protein
MTLYDEINALGGVADPNDERSIGRMENLDEVLAILERHGLVLAAPSWCTCVGLHTCAKHIEVRARQLCADDGVDPDEHIVGGQAQAFEDYGPRWQAEERSEHTLGITDYAGLARAFFKGPTQ